MGFLSVLSYAHKLAAERLGSLGGPQAIAVDATAGTGADTLMLAQAAGAGGQVYSFDIQQQALDRTSERLGKYEYPDRLARTELVLDSHDRMKEHIPAELHGRLQAVMFNLGYLPAGDTSVITRPESTLPALTAALELLDVRGVLTIVLYPGHAGGAEEAEAVQQWASSLPTTAAQCIIYRQLQRSDAPYLIAIEKKQL
ncbi:class I SAM-dependent methyltransferase [Paenibacillus wulumuqiensis]|uniref:class I SAM-dependent methyltransferase n=1 Tax=Paenibacillus wulumuqiensis TaxID=1567107 RepID=UPI00061992FE|nr:class I SAM-dependent methyltransferase [Paenibacillus wulumuqiensis]